MNIFEQADYRQVLRKSIEERKRLDRSMTQQNLALAMKVQKSYLSAVFSNRAELSTDQLYLACNFLGFEGEEREYLFLLLEHARTGLKERRDKLRAQIEAIRSRKLETKEHISAPSVEEKLEKLRDYYLDPLHQIVHISLLIKKYRTNTELLARDLGLPHDRLLELLRGLERMELIQSGDKGIQVLVKALHLPRENTIYSAWRNQLRSLGAQRVHSVPAQFTYSFSVLFGAAPKSFEKVRFRILELLKEIEAEVGPVPAEKTFQLSIDLFPWTHSE